MNRFDRSDVQRFAISAIGALMLTAAAVVAAAGPVKAASANAQQIAPQYIQFAAK